MKFNIPILLLTYKRPETTSKILKKIYEVNPKKIYIFQDGIKTSFNYEEGLKYNKTTELIEKSIKNYSNTKIYYHRFKKNIGQKYIGKSIMDIVFKIENKIIVLEDDTLPNKSFFKYCKAMLKKYENNNKIFHISGCNLYNGYLGKKISKEDFFLSKYPHWWGWATWKSKWYKYYDPDMRDWKKNKKKFLSQKMNNKKESRFFDYYLSLTARNKHICWDLPWLYKMILYEKLTVVPTINLIKNIGFDYSPEGKGSIKFRNLKSGKITFEKILSKNVYKNLQYDEFLRKNFYSRDFLLVIMQNKIIKFIRKLINLIKL